MAAGFQAPGLLKLGQQQQTSLLGPVPQATVHPQTVATTASHTVLTIGQTAPQTGGATTTGQIGLTTGLGTTGLNTTTGLKTGLGGVTGQTGLTTGLGITGQTGLTTGLGTTGQTGLKTGLGTTGQTGLTTGLGATGQTGLTTGLGTTGLKTGLTGLNKTGVTATTVTGLGGGVTTTTSSHVTGLGGASNGITSKTKVKSVSEGDVPTELSQLITQFELFMTAQKDRSDKISKSSESFEKKFRSLGDDIDTHQKQAVTITQQLHQLNSSLSSLKDESVKEGQVVDIAQRTRELPAGLQHENTAPDEYFQKTVHHFEKRMQVFRNQLEELESYLHVFSTHPMDSGDILGALDAQYKPFLLLAARLQVVHEEIQRLKEQYVNMRRLMGLESADLFVSIHEKSKRNDKTTLDTSQKIGPSPFAASIAQATAALTAMATAGGGGTIGLGGTIPGAGIGGMGTGLGGMGTGLGGMGTGLGGMGTGLGGMGTGLGGMGTGLGGMGTGLGGMGAGLGTSIGGAGNSLGRGIGTGLGGMGTGLGGIGTGLGGMGTGLGGMGTGLGRGIGMGANLGGPVMGTGLGGIGGGMGGGLNTGMAPGLGTGGLSVAGTTKPFQLKPPPMGKRKT